MLQSNLYPVFNGTLTPPLVSIWGNSNRIKIVPNDLRMFEQKSIQSNRFSYSARAHDNEQHDGPFLDPATKVLGIGQNDYPSLHSENEENNRTAGCPTGILPESGLPSKRENRR